MSKRHKITIDFDNDGDLDLRTEIQSGATRNYVLHALATATAEIIQQMGGDDTRKYVAKEFFTQYLEEALFDGIEPEQDQEEQ